MRLRAGAGWIRAPRAHGVPRRTSIVACGNHSRADRGAKDRRAAYDFRITTEPHASGSSTICSGLPAMNWETARRQAELDSGLL